MDADGPKITAPSNPYVKYARRLQRRRVRDKEGRCLLEGVRLVADAAEAGASLYLGFWESALLRTPGGEELLRRLRARPPVGGLFEVHPQVMAVLADTETPQGIVVVAARPDTDPRTLLESPPSAASRGGRTVAVLDGIRDPGNVGTVIRSADASGAAGVVFLPGTADPWSPKALRASMGSAFHIPVVAAEQVVLAYRGERVGDRVTGRTGLAFLLPLVLERLGYRILVADPGATKLHWQARLDGRAALVFGGEAEGPDPRLWAKAERIAIPIYGGAESLNVAMAAAVLLYEATRQREGWGTVEAGTPGCPPSGARAILAPQCEGAAGRKGRPGRPETERPRKGCDGEE